MTSALIHPHWPVPANARAVVTTRHLPGNSLPPFAAFNLGLRCGEDVSIVRANRETLVRMELPAAPRWLGQIHGTQVVDCTSAAIDDSEPPADAAIARSSGTVLAILTADCLPLLVCAEDGSQIAAIHAGWRGMAGGVIETCIEKLSTPPAQLLVWLGPAIGPRSYEVGEEVRTAFIHADASAVGAFVATRPGHWFCDLYTLARRRLAALGISRVYGGDFDTFTDPRFYSYRRDKVTGRFASLIWIQS